HVKGISDGKDISAALEWCETAVAERPVPTAHAGGRQATTDATQVRIRDTQLPRLTAATAKGVDLIEDAVESEVELVDVAVGEDVRFGYGRIAAMIGNVLVAAERILF